MTGQISMFDLLPKEQPAMPRPGVYSRSGRQLVQLEKNGSEITISIWTDNETMLCRVNAEELKQYFKGVIDG